jgi:type VI secretion system protein ImpC
LLVDRDNLDAVLARTAPSLELTQAGGAEPLHLSFAELDDFHPDRLYDRLAASGIFGANLDESARPDGDSGFETGRTGKTGERGSQPAAPAPPPPVPGALLDQIVSESTPDVDLATSDRGLQDFVRRIVAPHEVPRSDPRHAESLARLDETIAEHLREILHRQDFQALEALWRGVSLVCRRVETSPLLKLFLVDVSQAELALDQMPEVPLHETELYRLLVESTIGTPGSVPWSLIVGCYSFGPGMEDAKLLARLGAIAKLAGAPWLSGAESALVGCPSFGTAPDPDMWAKQEDDGWEAVRLLPYAGWLGLAMPRFLLRLPYGKDTDECEKLMFEEMVEEQPEHESYLWGNPALLCTLLLLQEVAAHGWEFRPGSKLEVRGLPLHTFRRDGKVIAQPCAEALLTERALTRITDRGLMAFASLKDRDAVRLLRLQSVSNPPTSLDGPWA